MNLHHLSSLITPIKQVELISICSSHFFSLDSPAAVIIDSFDFVFFSWHLALALSLASYQLHSSPSLSVEWAVNSENDPWVVEISSSTISNTRSIRFSHSHGCWCIFLCSFTHVLTNELPWIHYYSLAMWFKRAHFNSSHHCVLNFRARVFYRFLSRLKSLEHTKTRREAEGERKRRRKSERKRERGVKLKEWLMHSITFTSVNFQVIEREWQHGQTVARGKC